MLKVMMAAVLLSGSVARGAIIVQQTLGELDFADLATAQSATYLTAAGNEASPFNQIFGGDAVANGSFSWTFSYSVIAQSIGSASILMALYETESSASGNQIASFTLNGVDLTAALNVLHESIPGVSSQIVHYTLNLPSPVFAQLASGTATFSLTLQGPGLGVLGDTTFNGGGIDFSTLTINDTANNADVPEPASIGLVASGLLAAAFARRFASRP
ncbi:MAG: PEP-CTERM sorting domain-containing protein [Bryobacterales bacterium]|nr:PEP-CTERM sorting domain-containing protein [Bryobacterales bacterium]